MISRSVSPPPRSLLALAFAVVFVSCDLADPEADPGPEADVLSLKFTQRDGLGQVAATLGTYSVLPSEPLSLRGALAAEVSIEGWGGGLAYGRVSGDPDREVVVFLLAFDTEGTMSPSEAGAYMPGVRGGPIEAEPTAEEPALPIHGMVYAFFIEGVGDRPDVPVEMILLGTETTQRLVVDPDLHMLPARYAFQLNGADTPILPDLGPGQHLEAEFGFEGGEAEPRAYSSLLPLYVWQVTDGVGAGAANVGLRAGIGYLPPLTEFKFYLFFVER